MEQAKNDEDAGRPASRPTLSHDADCDRPSKTMHPGAPGGAVYGLGMIGAAVYYIQTANGLGEGIVGFLKALVWPAFLVYDVLRHLGV